MAQFKYVIVGGGMAGYAALEGIREVDRDGSVAMFGAEPDRPYRRPPLTKGLWKGEEFDSIWYDAEAAGVDLRLDTRVRALRPAGRTVILDGGEEHSYEKLLLATGGTPRRLPFDDAGAVTYFRTADDYRRLRAAADRRQRFAVIGGGFIGSELAAALAMNGKEVTVIVRGDGVCSHVFPADLSASVNDYYREKGVRLITQAEATGVRRDGERVTVAVQSEGGGTVQDVAVDGVVAGLGIEPDVELARDAGLAVENGIVVDEHLRTSAPDVYAAGDVAFFHNPALGKRIRVEHEDNATTMGRAAGRNMAGAEEPYDHLPFFYSDLFDLGYEAVGELDSRLEAVSDWKEPYRTGVVYYLAGGRVRGALLWNVWEQVDAARRLIAEPGPFTAAAVKGRIPLPS